MTSSKWLSLFTKRNTRICSYIDYSSKRAYFFRKTSVLQVFYDPSTFPLNIIKVKTGHFDATKIEYTDSPDKNHTEILHVNRPRHTFSTNMPNDLQHKILHSNCK